MCDACQTALSPLGLVLEKGREQACPEDADGEVPRCERCGERSDRLYRMGTGSDPMTLCGRCRSEFVGE